MSYTNPETGRKVKQNTKTFNKLLQNYDFDQTKGFTPKNVDIQYYKDPSGFVITQKMAERWAKRNKTYKLEKNMFKAVVGITVDTPEETLEHLDNAKVMKLTTMNGVFIKPFQKKSYSRKYDELYQFLYDHESDLVVSITIYKTNNAELFSIAHDGKTNCFMELVKERLLTMRKSLTEPQQQLYEELQEGVMPQDIQNIANSFKLNIKINIYGETHYFKGNDQNKTLKLYYDNFHVSKSDTRAEKPKLFTFIKKHCKCNITNLSFDSQTATKCKCDPLTQLYNNTKNEDITEVIYTNELLSFSTNKYKYKNRSIEVNTKILDDDNATTFLLDDNTYNLAGYFRNNLTSYIEGSYPRPLDNFHLSDYLTRAININFTNLQAKEYQEIDIKSAYDPTPNKEYPSNLDIRITTTKMLPHLGFYLITIHDPIYNQLLTQIYSTDELEVFNKHSISYTIHQAYLSSSTFKVKDNWREFKTYIPRIFQMWLGYIQRKTSNKVMTTTDPEVSIRYGGCKIREGLYQFSNQEEIKARSYMPHVAGFFQAHARSKLYDYLLSNPNVKPLRIWTDNIVVEKTSKLPLNEYFSSLFKHGKKEYKNENVKTPYMDLAIPNELITDLPLSVHPILQIPNNGIVYLNGFAGTGKTYLINELIPILDQTSMTYERFAPTYKSAKLIDAKVIQKFLFKPSYLHADIIIIDEASMITQSAIDTLRKYTKALIILSGDHEHQLLTINNDDIDFSLIPTLKLTECKRTEDKDYIEKTLNIDPNQINLLANSTKIDLEDNNQIILCSTNNEIDELNQRFYDISKNTQINNKLKLHMPVVVNKNKIRQATNGEIYNGTQGIFVHTTPNFAILQTEDYQYHVLTHQQINQADIKPAFAMTYHKAQGQTYENKKVVLSTRGLYNFSPDTQRRMLYVGATRVRKAEQLFYI